ncbi:MAG: type II toxin-antitoxin system HicB family antitoxin [Candidatus Gottesmanbacteria bacterium]|nr:type II toxin-antitoxin system HicB family antitoxin [Candidatus Gottesmanbacteria bacterium]
MKIHHYTAIFQKEPEGGYTVVIPALPGCVTYGKSIEEAANAAKEAIESYLGSLAKDGEPTPTDVSFVSTIDVPHGSGYPVAYA